MLYNPTTSEKWAYKGPDKKKKVINGRRGSLENGERVYVSFFSLPFHLIYFILFKDE